MAKVLVIKLGNTFPHLAASLGDFEDWVVAALEADPGTLIVRCPPRGDELPDPDRVAGAVVTGSHAMVTDRHDWSERTAAWLRDAVGDAVPVLGICYGHQLLAHALGGEVHDNPGGREFGTSDIVLRTSAAADPLFHGLPPAIKGHVCHTQSVVALPPGTVLLASNARDPHQAFRLGACAWGVQFHPEFSAAAARAYVAACARELRAEGQDPEALARGICETPESKALLRRFGGIVAGR